ncbi:MAG: DNA mismatch repair protein MutL, partial [Pirellulaceae bacterium]
LRQALDLLQTEGKVVDRRDVLDELLHMMSCKAAVKAGDPLSEEEIQALIEYRDLCQDAHHCPHGRPTALVFSREELDRRFKRI